MNVQARLEVSAGYVTRAFFQGGTQPFSGPRGAKTRKDFVVENVGDVSDTPTFEFDDAPGDEAGYFFRDLTRTDTCTGQTIAPGGT